MDRKTWLSSIAEAKTVSEYLKNEWEVYTQTSGKGPFDLVVYKDKTLWRVQVKATETTNVNSASYIAQLRSIRSNRTKNVIKPLDPSSYDELAIYVEPLDCIFFFTVEEVAGRNSISIHPKKLDEFRDKPKECVRVVEDAALKAVGS